MLKSGMHFGHRTSRWHPKMAPYIFGQRAGVHIIDLRKTYTQLETAIDYLKKMAAENKTILFVGTKDQIKDKLTAAAKEVGMPYVANRWIGGTLTNFEIIKKQIKSYLDLREKKETGKLEKYTKKERVGFDKAMAKLEIMVGGLTTLKKMPDVIFIFDIKNDKTALAEAKKKGIAVVAVCDTNVNPDGVNYVIPANDDASKAISLIIDAVVGAIKEGQADAEKNKSEEMKKRNKVEKREEKKEEKKEETKSE